MEIPTQPVRGKFSGVTSAPQGCATHPLHLPPSRGTQRGAGRLGAKPGSPQARVAGRSELGPARGIPAELRRPGDGGDDRRPGLPGLGRSGQVQRHPLPADPSQDPRGLYTRGTPAARPVPETPPGTPRIPDAPTPALRTSGRSRGSVASPSPPPPPQRPQRPHAPLVPSRPAAAPVPAVAVARPPPSLCLRCAGAAPNPTHIATHSL